MHILHPFSFDKNIDIPIYIEIYICFSKKPTYELLPTPDILTDVLSLKIVTLAHIFKKMEQAKK